MFDNLRVATIDSKLAKMVVEKKHYLHRKPTTRFCFGLFDKETLLGVLILSQPTSPNVVKSVLGKENIQFQNQLIELNRLWVDDICPRNTESWFISRALAKVPNHIIISYSDTEYGHKGIVYRAANFYYAGSISPNRTHKIKKANHHPRALKSNDRKNKDFVLKQYAPKIRYWTVTGNKTEKKKLKKLVQWPILNWKLTNIPA